MELVRWEKKENIAVITMGNGANRQNLDFARQMNGCCEEILGENSIQSLVLTSSDPKNFSQGVDLEWLTVQMGKQDFKAIKAFMYEMNTVFKTLLLMPIPAIAAINGHAFGNGAILSCACDFRLMSSDKGFFCFPEVDVNVPFLPGMLAFVRKAVPEYLFNEMLLTGKRMTAPELQEHHVITAACKDQEELLEKALEFAGGFAKKRPIFGELKKRKYKEVVRVIDEEDPLFIEPLKLMAE